jgi:hypothetical protein
MVFNPRLKESIK